MIPLTAATSWLLLIALGALGVTFAVLLARHLEAVDEWREVEKWKAIGRAMERYGYRIEEADALVEAEHDLDRPFDWRDDD